MTAPDINTHGLVMEFGKHKGMLVTRVPAGYLRWAANLDQPFAGIAKAELQRRGHALPKVEISGHAIDGASLRCRKIWHENRGEDEGLHAWLQRVTLEAIEHGERLESGKIRHLGMKLVIEQGEEYPVLVSAMR